MMMVGIPVSDHHDRDRALRLRLFRHTLHRHLPSGILFLPALSRRDDRGGSRTQSHYGYDPPREPHRAAQSTTLPD